MTPWQVRNLYLCERDKDGKVMVEHDMEDRKTPKGFFYEFWRKYGLRDDLIEKLWKEKGLDDE